MNNTLVLHKSSWMVFGTINNQVAEKTCKSYRLYGIVDFNGKLPVYHEKLKLFVEWILVEALSLV